MTDVYFDGIGHWIYWEDQEAHRQISESYHAIGVFSLTPEYEDIYKHFGNLEGIDLLQASLHIDSAFLKAATNMGMVANRGIFDRELAELAKPDSYILKGEYRKELIDELSKNVLFHFKNRNIRHLEVLTTNKIETSIVIVKNNNDSIQDNTYPWAPLARRIGEEIYQKNPTWNLDKIGEEVHKELVNRKNNGEKIVEGRGNRIPKGATIKRRALTGIKKQ